MAKKVTKKIEIEQKINDEWIVFMVGKMHQEDGKSFGEIGRWFWRTHNIDHNRAYYHRKWKKWLDSGKSLGHTPNKYVDVLPKAPLTAREKQLKKNGKALGNIQNENRELKRKNDALLKSLTGSEEKQLMELTKMLLHDDGGSLAAKVNKIKGNNYEILDTVKRLGIRGIVRSTYKSQAAKAMDLAKFLDKIIPLEDKAAEGLIEMEDKGRVPRTGKKEDLEKPVTFEINVKPRAAMSEFEDEINEIQKGNNDEN